MTIPTAVLDANALIPIRLASTLLWIAEAGCFQPLWSDRIQDLRNPPKTVREWLADLAFTVPMFATLAAEV